MKVYTRKQVTERETIDENERNSQRSPYLQSQCTYAETMFVQPETSEQYGFRLVLFEVIPSL